ncbi:MAG: DUF5712 family protein [Bacteroidota bacterium]
MITIIDKPSQKGNVAYDNKGKSDRLVNYLSSKKQKMSSDDEYFNDQKNNLSKEEVKDMINNNVKGLRADETKFISVSINPSYDELEHIKNDKEKMRKFVRECMENYAKNFLKKRGIKPRDVVWAGLMHEYRFFSGQDEKLSKQVNNLKQNGLKVKDISNAVNSGRKKTKIKESDIRLFYNIGEVKQGDIKPGNNMHAHVIISKRNRDMTKTLTPLVSKIKFNIINWQGNNEETFDRLFKYSRDQSSYIKYLVKNIGYLSEKISKMDVYDNKVFNKEKILNLAEQKNWDGSILINLRSLNWELSRGGVVDDPMKYIKLGRKEYFEELKQDKGYKKGQDPALSKITNDLKHKFWEPVHEDYDNIHTLFRKRKRKHILKQKTQ